VFIGNRINDENKQIPTPDRMKSFMTQGSNFHQGSVSEKNRQNMGAKYFKNWNQGTKTNLKKGHCLNMAMRKLDVCF